MSTPRKTRPERATPIEELSTPDHARTRKIVARLKKQYPEAICELDFTTPFELLVATILAAQCTDARVNIVTHELFRKYPTPQSYLDVEQEELERDIHSTGFFRNKAKSIRGSCRVIIDDFGGEVPRTMEELLRLPGVARKTANVVLGTAYGVAAGVVVDTHVGRLSRRLALTMHDDPEKVERDLMASIPRKEWTDFAHRLVLHGRRVCHARGPNCGACCLNDLCPSSEI
jgi:endonuclease III